VTDVELPSVVVVPAAPGPGDDAATQLAVRLGPQARCAPSVAVAARSLDRSSVQAWLVAEGDVDDQVVVTRAAKALPDPLPVMVVTDVHAAAGVVTLLRAGADGLVQVGADTEVMHRSLVAMSSGELVLPRAAVRHLASEVRVGALRSDRTDSLLGAVSRREREVCVMLYAGLATGEVATRLFVSAETVRSHLHAALRKLRLRSREELFVLLDSGR
jgi:DNA-binding NarL/FixJ family response regulator